MRVLALSCIDGRIHQAVFKGVLDRYPDAVVDLITEPGPDSFASKDESVRSFILDKIDLSVRVNGTQSIFCVAHHDCKGYSVDRDQHTVALKDLVQFMKKRYPAQSCHGLWINSSWSFDHLDLT